MSGRKHDDRAKEAIIKAGNHLRQLRLEAGLTIKEAENTSTVTKDVWRKLESGKRPIPLKKLRDIQKALGLDEDKYIPLKRDVEAAFTPLDQTWLDTQPDYKRGGLMLAACRERCGLTQTELSYLIQTFSIVAFMENGSATINKEYMEKFITMFQQESDALPEKERWFDDALAKRFRDTCEASNPKVFERNRAKRAMTKTHSALVGEIMPPNAQRQAGLESPDEPKRSK